MRKISKSPRPNSLTAYSIDFPNNTWDDFKNSNNGDWYREIKELVFNDQYFLCAYCETSLKNAPIHRQRIEHFHPKRDKSDPSVNWGLMWENLLGVCLGGEGDKAGYSIKQMRLENLSCDSHKEKVLSECAVEGVVLNPLCILESPVLFKFDKATCCILPDEKACGEYKIEQNTHDSVSELVQNTIRVFNLNCDRIIQNRRAVLNYYNNRVKHAKSSNDLSYKDKMAAEWFSRGLTNYFTTKRLLLGDAAERIINREINETLTISKNYQDTHL